MRDHSLEQALRDGRTRRRDERSKRRDERLVRSSCANLPIRSATRPRISSAVERRGPGTLTTSSVRPITRPLSQRRRQTPCPAPPPVRLFVAQLPRVSGNTGSTVLPQVSFNTPANDAYQATTAVARPTQPPILIVLLVSDSVPASAELPIPSKMNVTVSNKNTANPAPAVRKDATVMYPVKIPHAHRYKPIDEKISVFGSAVAVTCNSRENDSQKI